MGQDTTITITGRAGLTEDTVIDALESAGVEFSEFTIDTDSDLQCVIRGVSKFEPGGLASFASRMSLRAGATTEIIQQWDNRDADDAGESRQTYIGGKRRPTLDRVLDIVPADLSKSVQAVRAALIGDGDLAAAARWLVDGLDGQRPGESSAPASIRSVEVVDEWGTDYSDLFRSSFDFSEVVDADGAELYVDDGSMQRLTTSVDVLPIINRWVGSAGAHTPVAYTTFWDEGCGAYVIPFWDGTSPGYQAVRYDDEGRIPFDAVVAGLRLTATLTWSDCSTVEKVC